MTRGLYPAFDCDLDRVTSVKVICDVFGERSHKKGNHLHSIVEACMTHWNLTLGHIHAVSHRYVVQFLIPGKCRKTIFCAELVREIQGTDSPPLGVTLSGCLCIIAEFSVFINLLLKICCRYYLTLVLRSILVSLTISIEF